MALGNRTNLAEARIKGQATNVAKAAAFAAKVLPKIKELKGKDLTLDQIATILNEQEVKTFNGGEWYKSTISRLMKAAPTA